MIKYRRVLSWISKKGKQKQHLALDHFRLFDIGIAYTKMNKWKFLIEKAASGK